MSVSVEDYNALLARVERLEAAVGSGAWDSTFTPATGGFAKPTKPSQAEDRPVTPLLGDYEMLVTGGRSSERAAENCVFWNPWPRRGDVPDECYLRIRKPFGLLDFCVLAKVDPTVKEGTMETGMLTRLNCELPLDRNSVFRPVTEALPVCKELKVKLTDFMITAPTSSSPAPVTSTEVLNSLRGCYAVLAKVFVVLDSRDGGKIYYKALVQSDERGLVTDETSIIVV
jgi:hypothetical protein